MEFIVSLWVEEWKLRSVPSRIYNSVSLNCYGKAKQEKAKIWEKPGFTCLGLKGLDIIIYVKKLL